MKNYCSFLLLFLTVGLFAQTEKPANLFSSPCRKVTNDQKENSNPLLTASGIKSHYCRELENKPLSAIYGTNYKRTESTARPTAENQKKEIKLYDQNLTAAAA
jgi:hypothetical protein